MHDTFERVQPPVRHEGGLTRRAVLLGGAGALLLAACGGDDDDSNEAGESGESGESSDEPTTTTVAGGLAIARVFDPRQPAGKPLRLPLALASADGAILPAESTPETIEVQWYPEGSEPGEAITIEQRAEDIPTPYFPLEVTFDAPGTYRIDITADGGRAATTVDAIPAEQAPAVPGPGEALLTVVTPTTADARGIDPVCTRDPDCPFHTEPLDEVIGGPKAIALIVSTPAFCQTAICGPVLDLLVDRAEQYADVLSIVHAEVYTDETAKTITETVQAYGMTYEPALFLATPDGTIQTRLDYTFDGSELDEALSRLVQ
jgi:hypothetical protein